jgi:hypothetical protein
MTCYMATSQPGTAVSGDLFEGRRVVLNLSEFNEDDIESGVLAAKTVIEGNHKEATTTRVHVHIGALRLDPPVRFVKGKAVWSTPHPLRLTVS